MVPATLLLRMPTTDTALGAPAGPRHWTRTSTAGVRMEAALRARIGSEAATSPRIRPEATTCGARIRPGPRVSPRVRVETTARSRVRTGSARGSRIRPHTAPVRRTPMHFIITSHRVRLRAPARPAGIHRR